MVFHVSPINETCFSCILFSSAKVVIVALAKNKGSLTPAIIIVRNKLYQKHALRASFVFLVFSGQIRAQAEASTPKRSGVGRGSDFSSHLIQDTLRDQPA